MIGRSPDGNADVVHVRHMPAKRVRTACIMLLAVACADLSAMLSLRQGLATRFNEPGISINLSNHTALSVMFVNSKLASLPDSDRAVMARQVAEYVRDHYRGYASLISIAVGFEQAGRVGVFSYTMRKSPYSFSTVELGPPQDTLPAQRTQ